MMEFDEIKKMAMVISRHNGACKAGYHDLLRAENIGQLCMVMKKYWADVIGMHRTEAFAALDELYPLYKADFNRCGIYYNESTDIGMCIVNRGGKYLFGGNARVWMFGSSAANVTGKAHIVARDKAMVTAMQGAHVQLFDEASATAVGYCYIHGTDTNLVQCMTHAHIVGCKRV